MRSLRQSPVKIHKEVITYPDSIDPDELFEKLTARLIGRFAFQQMGNLLENEIASSV